MQIEGGYKYPSGWVLAVLSVLAVLAAGGVAIAKDWGFEKAIPLWLSLEGTALLASAFTPTGLEPPPQGVARRIVWFVGSSGVPVKFSQALFYSGLLALFLASVLGAVWS